MNKDLAIGIFAATTDDRRRDRGPDKGVFGTGYPVGPDLILSARHVASPTWRNHKHPLAVGWADGSDGVLRWRDLDEPVEVIWEGKGDIDVALLRCPLPADLAWRDVGLLSWTPPSHGDWESRGFPAVSKRGKLRKSYDFSGTAETTGSRNTRFVVKEVSSTEKPQGWQGASGMPVFQHGLIIGVVVEVPTGLGNRVFRAVPSGCLLADKAFRELYNGDQQQRHHQRTATQLVGQLRGNERIRDGLATSLGIPRDDVEQCCTKVTDKILDETPVDRLLDSAVSIQRQVGGEEAALRDLILTVLPARQEPRLVETVQRLRFNPGSTPMLVSAALPTVAELVMAAADGRAAAFLPMTKADEFPGGVQCLSKPPEGGRDRDGAQFLKDVMDELIGIEEAQAGEQRLPKFEKYLRHRFARDLDDYDWSDLRGYIADELREKAEKKGLSYYFIVSPKARTAATALETLKREFPHLIFLQLDGSRLRDERNRYSALRELLFQTSEHLP